MASSSYQLFILAMLLPWASCDSVIHESCSQNFTNDNALHDNINRAFIDMIGKVSSNGSVMSTVGDGKSTVYGLAECRGDIFNISKGCSDCVVAAAQKLQADCINTAAGKIWYDFCSIRFDTNNFFGTVDVSITRTFESVRRADDPEAFYETVWQLLEWVKMSAATKSSRFGIGKKNFAREDKTIYGMAQCTQDLSGLACIGCLTQMSNALKQGCPYQQGCVVVTGSCRLRYDMFNFLLTADVPLFPGDQHTSPAPAPLPN